ncbi:MAG: metallophosphoesterase [Candidatus Aminicenantales bacterium]
MIGILSDTHDNLDAVRRAVRFFRDAECSLVIHAGDFVAPFAAQVLAEAGCMVKAVFGNCDGEKFGLKTMIEPFGTIRRAPFIFNHEGKKVALIHLNNPVEELSARQAFDLIVFGHTHRPEIRKTGRSLIVNPGETGGWVTKKCTVALYDPATGTAAIHEI